QESFAQGDARDLKTVRRALGELTTRPHDLAGALSLLRPELEGRPAVTRRRADARTSAESIAASTSTTIVIAHACPTHVREQDEKTVREALGSLLADGNDAPEDPGSSGLSAPRPCAQTVRGQGTQRV